MDPDVIALNFLLKILHIQKIVVPLQCFYKWCP